MGNRASLIRSKIAQREHARGRSAPVVEERTRSGVKMRTERGTHLLSTAIGPVHYWDAKGNAHEIDTTLTEVEPDVFETVDTEFRIEVRRNGNRRVYPRGRDGEYIEFGPPQYRERPRGGPWQNFQWDVAGSVDDDRITWDGPDASLIVTVQLTGVKVDLVLKHSGVNRPMRWPRSIHGMIRDLNQPDRIVLKSVFDDAPVLSMPDPFVLDANGDRAEIGWEFGNQFVHYDPVDDTGLAYPLTIDPTADTFSVAAGTDDGYWHPEGSNYNNSASAVYFGIFSINAYLSSFIRFQNVTVPAGTSILDAYVTQTPASDYSSSITVDIDAHDADDPSAPTSVSDANNAARTTASVEWQPGPWTNNVEADTPDISSVIQEIVNRGGWLSSNAIVVFYNHTSTGSTTRGFDSYDGSPSTAAVLTIEYETEERRQFNSGSLTGADGADSHSSASNISHSTANPFEGSGHIRASAAANEWLNFDVATWDEIYVSFAFYQTAHPANTVYPVRLMNGGTTVARLRQTSSGQLALQQGFSTVGSSSGAVPLDTWNTVGIHFKRGAASNATFEAHLNDTVFVNETAQTQDNPIDEIRLGSTHTDAITFDADDLAWNDTTWATHTEDADALTTGTVTVDNYAENHIFLTANYTGDVGTPQVEVSTDNGSNWTPVSHVQLTDSGTALTLAAYGLTTGETYTDVRVTWSLAGGTVSGTNPVAASGGPWALLGPYTRPNNPKRYVRTGFWYMPYSADATAAHTEQDYAEQDYIVTTANFTTSSDGTHWATKIRSLNTDNQALDQYILANEIRYSGDPQAASPTAATAVNHWCIDSTITGWFNADVEESWFLHDDVTTTDRIAYNDGQAKWVMNPGDAGWRAFTQRAAARIIQQYFGTAESTASKRRTQLFLDNLDARTTQRGGATNEYGATGINDSYRAATVGMVAGVRTVTGRVGGNITQAGWSSVTMSDSTTGTELEDIAKELDTAFYEQHFGKYSGSTEEYKSASNWKADVDNCIDLINTYSGLTFVGASQMVEPATNSEALPAETVKKIKYGTASWLIARPSGSDVDRLILRHADNANYARLRLHDEMGWDFGEPTGAYTNLTGDIYRRDFVNGFVELNVGTTTQTATGGSGTSLDAHEANFQLIDTGVVSDAATAGASVSGYATAFGAASDAATSSESVSAQLPYSGTVNDTATSGSSLATSVTGFASFSSGATTSGTVTATVIAYGSVQGSAASSGTLTVTAVAFGAVAGSATGGETVVAMPPFFATVSDIATSGETVTATATLSGAASDAATSGSTIQTVATVTGAASDGATSAEAVAAYAAVAGAVTAAATSSETISTQVEVYAQITAEAEGTATITYAIIRPLQRITGWITVHYDITGTIING